MSISPIMSYGLKRTALIKANRTQLRKYERLLTQNMAASASDHNNQTTHESLLIVSVTGHTFKEDLTTHILKDSKIEFKKH
jgi:hypothetical protein